MTPSAIKKFVAEIFAKTPKRKCITSITNFYHFDDTSSLDIIDLINFGREIIGDNRCFLRVIDNFTRFGWTVPLNIKHAQTTTNSFENILKSSKKKPKLIEIDNGAGFLKKLFTNLLNNKDNKTHSGKSSLGVFFAERSNRTFRDPLKKSVLGTVMVLGLTFYLYLRSSIIVEHILLPIIHQSQLLHKRIKDLFTKTYCTKERK